MNEVQHNEGSGLGCLARIVASVLGTLAILSFGIGVWLGAAIF